MNKHVEQDWNNATWLGSRRVMIRQSLKLTIRQRLQALEDLYATSQALPKLKKSHNSIHEPAGNYTPDKPADNKQ